MLQYGCHHIDEGDVVMPVLTAGAGAGAAARTPVSIQKQGMDLFLHRFNQDDALFQPMQFLFRNTVKLAPELIEYLNPARMSVRMQHEMVDLCNKESNF